MEKLKRYVKKCLKPRNKTELHEMSDLTKEHFSQMQQDAFVFTSIRPSIHQGLETIQVGPHFISKRIKKPIAWYDQSSGRKTFTNSRAPLYRRLVPGHPETVNHPLIIQCIIEAAELPSPVTYIEYGVRKGDSLLPISKVVDESHAVDIKRKLTNLPPKCTFHEMTTDRFSAEILPDLKFNVAFIDADHSSVSAFRDFENLYQQIDQGGYIFLHDTYPCLAWLLSPGACNDCFKTPLMIRKKYPDAELLTFPLNPGVTVVRKPTT